MNTNKIIVFHRVKLSAIRNQSASIAGGHRVKNLGHDRKKIFGRWPEIDFANTHTQYYIDNNRHTMILLLFFFSTATVNRPADKGVVCRSAATVVARDEGFGEGRRSMVFYATADPTGPLSATGGWIGATYAFRLCNNIIHWYDCLLTDIYIYILYIPRSGGAFALYVGI